MSWSTPASLPQPSVTASCEAIAIVASGTFTASTGGKTVTMAGLGPSAAQAWAFVGSPTGGVVAAGVFTWTDTTEITNCLTGSGTSTMTLWGAIAVVTT